MGGSKYYFTNAEAAKLFSDNPTKFLPQFGGYCAHGVQNGQLLDVDPAIYMVSAEEKLYLFASAEGKEEWVKNFIGALSQASAYWSKREFLSAAAPVEASA